MKLLDAVIGFVGILEHWPSSVLQVLFAFDLRTPHAIDHLDGVVAFFYGNGVPCHIACQMFARCSFIPTCIVRTRFYFLYYKWSRPSHMPDWSIADHKHLYFDIRDQRFRYTDGTYPREFRTSAPVVGFNATGFPTVIRSILLQLSDVELIDADVYEGLM